MRESYLYRTVLGTHFGYTDEILKKMGIDPDHRQMGICGFRDLHFEGDTIILTFRTSDEISPGEERSYDFLINNKLFLKQWVDEDDPSFVYHQFSRKDFSLGGITQLMKDDPYHDPRPPMVKMKDLVERFVNQKPKDGDFQMKELRGCWDGFEFKDGEEETVRARLWKDL